MIRIALFPLLLLFSQSVAAEEIQIPDTKICLDAPAGFTSLTQEEIAVKFPSVNPPKHVVGNERRATTIAYGVRDIAITDDLVESQIDAVERVFGNAIPGFVSIDRGMRTLGTRKWAYFEMKSDAIDTEIHNIVLMSVHEGRMIVLNFNSTKDDFVAMEPRLRSSISSLGPCK